MEPEVEKIIRKKILETEQQPVYWNKSGAWIKIQEQEAFKPFIPVYAYYAAAAITFFIVVGSLVMVQYNKSQLAIRIHHLENILQKAEATDRIKQENTFLKAECNDKNKTSANALPVLAKLATKKSKLTTIAATKKEDTVPQVPVETQDNKSLQSEPIDSAPVSIATATAIEPVIGLYDSTEKIELVTKVRKKHRVHWLRAPEFKSTEEITKNTILIARIK
jgi:hypothetical protein